MLNSFSHAEAQYVESFNCLPSTVRMKHFKDLLLLTHHPLYVLGNSTFRLL